MESATYSSEAGQRFFLNCDRRNWARSSPYPSWDHQAAGARLLLAGVGGEAKPPKASGGGGASFSLPKRVPSPGGTQPSSRGREIKYTLFGGRNCKHACQRARIWGGRKH